MHRDKRFLFLVALVALFLALPAGRVLADEASVVLKSKVEILGNEITLREVADIKGQEEELAKKLRTVSLGRTPRPGYTRYIPSEQIAARLRAEGISPAEVRIEGARGVLIGIKSVMLSGEELLRLGKDFIQSELSTLAGERIIEIARAPADFLAPMGKGLTTYKVGWHNVPKHAGAASVDVRVLVDGSLFTTVPVQYNIRLFETALVATTDIPRGEAFTPSNTKSIRTEITRIQGKIVSSLEEMSLYRAKRRISAGSVIRIEDGLMPDLVVRGSTVAVTVRNGALTLRARGVARQNGALGAMIEVLNPDSKRTFKAAVTGLNQVEVNL